MEEEITKAGLQNVPGFHKKVIQMFDIFNIRFGADSASRRVETPSRHRRDSSPGMMDVGGFFLIFESRRFPREAPTRGKTVNAALSR